MSPKKCVAQTLCNSGFSGFCNSDTFAHQQDLTFYTKVSARFARPVSASGFS